MKKQTLKDRRDERRGEKKEMKGREKEAAAGRRYNRSEKHRKAESRGMKKAMRGR